MQAHRPVALTTFLESLEQERIVYMPVRHHSTACALHLKALIEELQPVAVLIEGPRDLSSLIPDLVSPQTIAPVALYVVQGEGQQRSAAYYPFCSHSPEYVAIQTATKLGAELSFIDLSWAEQEKLRTQTDSPLQSFLDEWYYRENPWIEELVKRTGSRDSNEAWDRLFEARYSPGKHHDFIREVAAYCWFLRQTTTESAMQRHGNAQREAQMALGIRAALKRHPQGRIVVVTGGFHTVALPDLVKNGTGASIEPPKAKPSAWLIPYSFERLDQLNGYAAGIPSPAFYHRLWEALEGGLEPEVASWQTASELLAKAFFAFSQAQLLHTPRSPDQVQVLAQAKTLAKLRGSKTVMRQDILDAIQSCLMQAEMSFVQSEIERQVLKVFASGPPGQIPPQSTKLPLLVDFHDLCQSYALKIHEPSAQRRTLDLFRSPKHTLLSHFFYQLTLLKIPFCRLNQVGRSSETWEWTWSPLTESSLIDVAYLGGTIAEASENLLRKQWKELKTSKGSAQASSSCSMLVQSHKIGMPQLVREFFTEVQKLIVEDASIPSLVEALEILGTLSSTVEEERRLLPDPALIEQLASLTFAQACYRIEALDSVTDDQVEGITRAICRLSDFGKESTDLAPDDQSRSYFFAVCKRLWTSPQLRPALRGAAGGILQREGILSEEELVQKVVAQLATRGNPDKSIEFLRGLLLSSRELIWQSTLVLQSMSDMIADWSEEDFVEYLPSLRLVFSSLSPRETDRTSAALAELLGIRLGSLRMTELSVEQYRYNVERELRAREVLKQDGLEALFSLDNEDVAQQERGRL